MKGCEVIRDISVLLLLLGRELLLRTTLCFASARIIYGRIPEHPGIIRRRSAMYAVVAAGGATGDTSRNRRAVRLALEM